MGRRPPRTETRQRVLDAAARVFAERGIAGASLREVAEAAGLTTGALYSNFAGKDELVLALMAEHVGMRLRRATEAVDDLDDADALLREVGARLIEAVQTDFTWQRLFLEYWGVAMRDEEVRAGLAARRREARAALTRAITRIADARGFALPVPAEQAAVVVLALSNGFAIERGIDAGAVPDGLFGRVLTLLAGDHR
ncbi:TetR/AcrR family transcriptional regulator [Amycolatopsis anabasis]|uniref:TetR/AcrR family transcriptional regulator n=1 Tax=Amycolatopsis anabasis TaxID=1840409 RepID=UPI00131B1C5A|nr:TetR/AcrR family transcriptional regulator [Amycolatopsis anabasis]